MPPFWASAMTASSSRHTPSALVRALQILTPFSCRSETTPAGIRPATYEPLSIATGTILTLTTTVSWISLAWVRMDWSTPTAPSTRPDTILLAHSRRRISHGVNSDLGRTQGWTNDANTRVIVKDGATGYYDIVAFGEAGVYVAEGQDPATHGGEAFGQLHLAMQDMGTAQGWSNEATPRLVGDVNGDGTPDIVEFGGGSTFVAVGERSVDGTLSFTMDWNLSIPDLGSSQGWDTTTVRTLGEHGSDAVLVLSGGAGTQTWDLVA